MKNVQIPEELFFNLCRYHLAADELDELDEDELLELMKQIKDGLKAKLEAMQRRQLYTAYKDTKATPESREAARQAYLDMVGMLPGYRWSSLEPPL